MRMGTSTVSSQAAVFVRDMLKSSGMIDGDLQCGRW
jgi:hypothetical protein